MKTFSPLPLQGNRTVKFTCDLRMTIMNLLCLRITDSLFHILKPSQSFLWLVAWLGITLHTVAAPGTGLKGEYYDDPEFTQLRLTRTDAIVDFSWGTGSPHATVGADTFSVRWTGQIIPRYSEIYTFHTVSDDGVRLSVDGVMVVNNWTDHAPTENSGTINLVAGQPYDITLEYYENGGGATMQLLWSSGSQAREVVPQSQLYPGTFQPSVNLTIDRSAGTNVLLSWPTSSGNYSLLASASLNLQPSWVAVSNPPRLAGDRNIVELPRTPGNRFFTLLREPDPPGIREGRYYIQLSTGRALEASSESFKANGAKIQTWKLYRGLNQLWEVKRAANGAFHLLNVGSGGRTLDAHDADVDRNGGRVQLYDLYPENRNQQWILGSLGARRYTIRCAASVGDKVIQIKGGVVDRSGEAELSDFNGSPSQIWTFTPASDAAIVRPDFVDLRPNQTPIKDQGIRGSCTYFGATAALEAAYKKAGYGDVNLSEEFWAMMGKALYIHPRWPEISHANYRENQFAGTQGGGSLLWYQHGFRLPREADVPYRSEDYTWPNWEIPDQKVANDFNFSLFTANVLRAPRYYGASSVTRIASDRLRAAAEYEHVLRLGFEVSINVAGSLYGGAHNVIIVGFDKTDSASPIFLIKNSWGPLNGDPTLHCERRSYADVLGDVGSAEYLTDVTEPAAWPELAFLGRWKLTFDGHKGALDIYHLPGIGNLPFDAPDIADRRIGVFYDSAGTAFRVNGSLSGNSIEFWFDGATPNLPWDQLSGRRFVYHLDPDLNVMTGFHYDGDGSRYGGYATKGSYLAHGTPSLPTVFSLPNATWNVLIGDLQGSVRFGPASGSTVAGVMSLAGGGTRNVEATLLDLNQVSFRVEGSLASAAGQFLNHEPGLLCGGTSDGLPFYAAFVARNSVPALP